MATKGKKEDVKTQQQRITDVSNEPLEFLSPIGGYEKLSAVPLEQAIEPLIDILPTIQSHAYIAKERCKKPAEGLTQDESASIMLYTMAWEPLDECLYYVLNKTLRLADRQKLKPWFFYLRLFIGALFRLPPVPGVVHRGVKLDLSQDYQLGEHIIWWAFSSTTNSLNILQSENFLGKTDVRTMFTIECQTGRNIRQHSYFACEDEILLLACTRFKVTGHLDQGNLHIIHLKEDPPPFPLLQPIKPTTAIAPPDPPKSEPVPMKNNSSNQNLNPISQTTSTLPKPVHHDPPKQSSSNPDSQLKKIINENQNRSRLELKQMTWTCGDMKFFVSHVLGKNTKLTTLDFGGGKFDDDSFRYFCESLRNNQTLTELNLGYSVIGAEGAFHLSEALKYNRKLTILWLSMNSIGNEGAAHLSQALMHNQVLTEIDLGYNQIGSEGTKRISEMLRHNQTLRILQLGGTEFGDAEVYHLVEALRKNQTLIRLEIQFNGIGDKGAQHLSEMLRHNKNLQDLNLQGNKIGNQGGQHLVEALQLNQTLQSLRLAQNEIDDEQLAQWKILFKNRIW